MCRLEHLPSGTVLADGAYSYSIGDADFGKASVEAGTVVLSGLTTTGIRVEHRFELAAGSRWLEEQIVLTNTGLAPVDLHDMRCAFAMPVPAQSLRGRARAEQPTFSAVPFLREPGGLAGEYAQYTLAQVLTEPFESGLWEKFAINTRPWGPHSSTPEFAAEAWVWREASAGSGFLITKYSQLGMEWSLLDRVPLSAQTVALRWVAAESIVAIRSEERGLPRVPHTPSG